MTVMTDCYYDASMMQNDCTVDDLILCRYYMLKNDTIVFGYINTVCTCTMLTECYMNYATSDKLANRLYLL
jgi:hypothetical protein